MRNIAVAGYIGVDVLKTIDCYPRPHSLVHIQNISYALGGAVPNTGRALARLAPEMTVDIYGLIGDDENGQRVQAELNRYPNINQSGVRLRGTTAVTDVLDEADTRARTFLCYRGANSLFEPEDIDTDALDCGIFHFGYILLLDKMDEADDEYGTRLARLFCNLQKKGIKTSVDVVTETGDRFTRLVPPALKYTDYAVINELEAEKTTGIPLRNENDELIVSNIPKALRSLRDMGVKTWAVIHAPEGGFGMDENGNTVMVGGAILPKDYIQGTVGAGDAFCAGVLLGANMGISLRDAIEQGIASACLSLRSPDASEGMDTLDTAMKNLAKLPRRTL